ncbi:MAG: hypothetical protein AAF394_00320 [Planctomycetota bacterium]
MQDRNREVTLVDNPFETPSSLRTEESTPKAHPRGWAISVLLCTAGAFGGFYAALCSAAVAQLITDMIRYPGFAELCLEEPLYLTQIVVGLAAMYGFAFGALLAAVSCRKQKWKGIWLWSLLSLTSLILYALLAPDFTHLPPSLVEQCPFSPVKQMPELGISHGGVS